MENNVGLSKVEIPPNTPFYNDLSSITATISGFGVDLLRFKPYRDNENKVVFDGYQSKKLHYAKTTILPDALCHMLTKVYLPNQQICAQMHQMSSTPEGTCRVSFFFFAKFVSKNLYLIQFVDVNRETAVVRSYIRINTSLVYFLVALTIATK